MNVPPDKPLKLQGALLFGHVEPLCSLLTPSPAIPSAYLEALAQ